MWCGLTGGLVPFLLLKFLLVHLYSYVPCEITSNIISSLKFSIELSANKYMYNSVDQALLY